MQDNQIDAWIVPSADPHQSEYVADCWQTRAWLSGFTGSAGILVVTQETASLWTDSRYHIRAANELADSGIELFRKGLPDVPSHIEWLQQTLPENAVVGFDGNVLSVRDVARLDKAFRGKMIKFAYQQDLVEQLWHNRPEIPLNPIFLQDLEFAGETRQSKFQRIRDKLKEKGAQSQFITTLDDIAWTFNIRGSDVQNNPVAISYAIISEQEVRLFIDPAKVPQDVKSVLEPDGVQFSEYEDIFSYWSSVSQDMTVLIDPTKTSYKLERCISRACQIMKGASISYQLKAIKNATEIDGMRQAHIVDGVAVVKWLYWLDHHRADNIHTEVTLVEKLAEFRSLHKYFKGLSFDSIIGYQANSAVGHYSPQPETTPVIESEGILLVDSGGQYLNGTTDITRTVTLATPTAEQKRVFTIVLKSLIKLSRVKFPKGTTGGELDTLVREVLWRQGYQCRHGIGHGTGSFLNVHEDPPRLSRGNNIALETGMFTTIEPGVYFEGKFGVRLENVVVTVKQETTEFGEFYAFETVTFCPIDIELIDASLLNTDEKNWLNTYHQKTYEVLSPFLSQDEQVWLRHATRAI